MKTRYRSKISRNVALLGVVDVCSKVVRCMFVILIIGFWLIFNVVINVL